MWIRDRPIPACMGHYQVTQRQLVPGSSSVVIRLPDGRFIDGRVARDLLRLPTDGVSAGELWPVSTCTVFVQSESYDRRLVRGTTLLYPELQACSGEVSPTHARSDHRRASLTR
eukprot:TRINITY_DN8138_c0_g1_i1.p1 TRINITY_DN8138_c0_g1~~TRINITY_DN8138_c0_g1_i1.p1  ORF type:complete len:114 (+),score=8.39 TRINITY_DN8138_c0_g1_i1:50-391(+)